MKRIFLLVIALLAVTFSQAQDITDAVRYSTSQLYGTARFKALSGAFGALGGDLSAMKINPAGSAIFNNSYSTVSLEYNSRNNDTRYGNRTTSSDDSDFNFSQAGAVLVFNSNDPENSWSKLTLGFNYSLTNNFKDDYVATGISSNSIDQYFLGYANGVPLDNLETVNGETIADLYRYLGENIGFGAQQAFLGYQAFVINPNSNDVDNTSYSSAIAPGNFDQQFALASTGLNGKFTFNAATTYKDFLYFGANLNAHFINYDKSTRYSEFNTNSNSEINEIVFRNNLSTTGDGFSFQLGTIAKVNDYVRLGVSYESPTWYSIQEESSQAIQSYSANTDEVVNVITNVVNVYPDYTLRTPGNLTGSLAILFGSKGLISFDYTYKDYSNTKFTPSSDPEFNFQNELISSNLQATSSFKVGGEYRIEDWSLRGGYRYEQSPYKNESTIGNLDGYSAGLGYNFGNIKLDVAYDHASRIDNPQFYQVGLTNTSRIERDFSNVVLSVSFGI